MRTSLLLIACLIPAFSLLAAAEKADQGEKEKPVQIQVATGEVIDVTPAKGWTHEIVQPFPNLPKALHVRSPERDTVLQISFVPVEKVQQDISSQEKVEALVKQLGSRYAEGSVEKKIEVKDLKSLGGAGAIVQFTDADLVGKPAKAGQYKVVATGVVVLGKSVAMFTLLSDSFEHPMYKAGVETLVKGVAKSAKQPENKQPAK